LIYNTSIRVLLTVTGQWKKVICRRQTVNPGRSGV